MRCDGCVLRRAPFLYRAMCLIVPCAPLCHVPHCAMCASLCHVPHFLAPLLPQPKKDDSTLFFSTLRSRCSSEG